MEEVQLPKSLEAVLVAIAAEDLRAGGKQRKTMLVGHSLGGWTMFAHSILYPNPQSPPSPGESLRSHVAGIYAIAPFLGIAAETAPSSVVVAVGKLIRRIKPDFPIEKAVQGKVFDHPDVDAEFYSDPQTYHGKIRCSTGLSLLRMTSFIQSHEGAVVVASLAIPVRVVHGDADRVCSASNSVEFVKKMSHVGEGKRKRECEIWEGYEHVMFGYGWDETDDRHREMRLRVLKDLHDWMVEQSSSG
ncbi:hypothetical protein BDY24DRAFT_414648 [Mrakia frigida]|uniref:uncharacterized protein n=1 Tax=Mrakia frigida TaxID=29902 RepID=UPI003FCC2511